MDREQYDRYKLCIYDFKISEWYQNHMVTLFENGEFQREIDYEQSKNLKELFSRQFLKYQVPTPSASMYYDGVQEIYMRNIRQRVYNIVQIDMDDKYLSEVQDIQFKIGIILTRATARYENGLFIVAKYNDGFRYSQLNKKKFNVYKHILTPVIPFVYGGGHTIQQIDIFIGDKIDIPRIYYGNELSELDAITELTEDDDKQGQIIRINGVQLFKNYNQKQQELFQNTQIKKTYQSEIDIVVFDKTLLSQNSYNKFDKDFVFEINLELYNWVFMSMLDTSFHNTFKYINIYRKTGQTETFIQQFKIYYQQIQQRYFVVSTQDIPDYIIMKSGTIEIPNVFTGKIIHDQKFNPLQYGMELLNNGVLYKEKNKLFIPQFITNIPEHDTLLESLRIVSHNDLSYNRFFEIYRDFLQLEYKSDIIFSYIKHLGTNLLYQYQLLQLYINQFRSYDYKRVFLNLLKLLQIQGENPVFGFNYPPRYIIYSFLQNIDSKNSLQYATEIDIDLQQCMKLQIYLPQKQQYCYQMQDEQITINQELFTDYTKFKDDFGDREYSKVRVEVDSADEVTEKQQQIINTLISYGYKVVKVFGGQEINVVKPLFNTNPSDTYVFPGGQIVDNCQSIQYNLPDSADIIVYNNELWFEVDSDQQITIHLEQTILVGKSFLFSEGVLSILIDGQDGEEYYYQYDTLSQEYQINIKSQDIYLSGYQSYQVIEDDNLKVVFSDNSIYIYQPDNQQQYYSYYRNENITFKIKILEMNCDDKTILINQESEDKLYIDYDNLILYNQIIRQDEQLKRKSGEVELHLIEVYDFTYHLENGEYIFQFMPDEFNTHLQKIEIHQCYDNTSFIELYLKNHDLQSNMVIPEWLNIIIDSSQVKIYNNNDYWFNPNTNQQIIYTPVEQLQYTDRIYNDNDKFHLFTINDELQIKMSYGNVIIIFQEQEYTPEEYTGFGTVVYDDYATYTNDGEEKTLVFSNRDISLSSNNILQTVVFNDQFFIAILTLDDGTMLQIKHLKNDYYNDEAIIILESNIEKKIKQIQGIQYTEDRIEVTLQNSSQKYFIYKGIHDYCDLYWVTDLQYKFVFKIANSIGEYKLIFFKQKDGYEIYIDLEQGNYLTIKDTNTQNLNKIEVLKMGLDGEFCFIDIDEVCQGYLGFDTMQTFNKDNQFNEVVSYETQKLKIKLTPNSVDWLVTTGGADNNIIDMNAIQSNPVYFEALGGNIIVNSQNAIMVFNKNSFDAISNGHSIGQNMSYLKRMQKTIEPSDVQYTKLTSGAYEQVAQNGYNIVDGPQMLFITYYDNRIEIGELRLYPTIWQLGEFGQNLYQTQYTNNYGQIDNIHFDSSKGHFYTTASYRPVVYTEVYDGIVSLGYKFVMQVNVSETGLYYISETENTSACLEYFSGGQAPMFSYTSPHYSTSNPLSAQWANTQVVYKSEDESLVFPYGMHIYAQNNQNFYVDIFGFSRENDILVMHDKKFFLINSNVGSYNNHYTTSVNMVFCIGDGNQLYLQYVFGDDYSFIYYIQCNRVRKVQIYVNSQWQYFFTFESLQPDGLKIKTAVLFSLSTGWLIKATNPTSVNDYIQNDYSNLQYSLITSPITSPRQDIQNASQYAVAMLEDGSCTVTPTGNFI